MSVNISSGGDPGKLAYFRNPNFTVTPQSQLTNIDPRVCPGCLFPHARRKHEHVKDERCDIYCVEHYGCAKCGGDLDIKSKHHTDHGVAVFFRQCRRCGDAGVKDRVCPIGGAA